MEFNITSVEQYMDIYYNIQSVSQFMTLLVFIGFAVMIAFLFLAIFKRKFIKIVILCMAIGMLIEIFGACGLIKATNKLGQLNNAYNVMEQLGGEKNE